MATQVAALFENVPVAPPDPILGLTDAFRKDPRPEKINLSVGVYQDENGQTPVLGVVKEAEKRILAAEKDKAYRPIDGDAAYGKLVRELLFGAGHEAVGSGRALTAHTPGGTGALRVAGDYLAKAHGKPTVWLSDPTWPNHPGVFQAAGLPVKTYAYFDAKANGVAFDAMLDALEKVQPGDVVLLHGGCHNPSGRRSAISLPTAGHCRSLTSRTRASPKELSRTRRGCGRWRPSAVR
jgi:aspartate/tyrosine/aromatic aminotransferase